jgi:hypothetical protein
MTPKGASIMFRIGKLFSFIVVSNCLILEAIHGPPSSSIGHRKLGIGFGLVPARAIVQ